MDLIAKVAAQLAAEKKMGALMRDFETLVNEAAEADVTGWGVPLAGGEGRRRKAAMGVREDACRASCLRPECIGS